VIPEFVFLIGERNANDTPWFVTFWIQPSRLCQ
jgi:hypothetical protein